VGWLAPLLHHITHRHFGKLGGAFPSLFGDANRKPHEVGTEAFEARALLTNSGRSSAVERVLVDLDRSAHRSTFDTIVFHGVKAVQANNQFKTNSEPAREFI
jgi:hypothetical protein